MELALCRLLFEASLAAICLAFTLGVAVGLAIMNYLQKR